MLGTVMAQRPEAPLVPTVQRNVTVTLQICPLQACVHSAFFLSYL